MPVPAPDYELGQFFDLSPDLLCIAGFDGYFKRLNPSFERVLGYSGEELVSRPFLEFVHPDDVERARDAFMQLATGEDVIGFECRLVCVDGSVRRFEWNTRTVPHLGVLYGIARDVTVRSALAEEQAARRRMATMVAEAAPPAEIFSAVSNEVAAIFHTELVVVGKFDGDPAELLVVGVGDGADEPVVGSRWKLDDALASAAVYRTGLPARHDHPEGGADLDVAAILERIRPVATVAVPIKVEGRLWGAMIISTLSEPLPPDTDERLQSFTDLIATALANAEARGEVERLADEQAALRQVAVLVAQQPSPSEVFTAVTQAVGLLLDADLAVLHVFPGDGTATPIASWSGDGPMLRIGTRFPLDGDNLAARIFATGAPARMYSDDEAWERAATDLVRSLRVRSAVGAPILVEGKLWGALMAATRGVAPWAENAETRIAAFTELVATAIANAESREALAELADEQAALRRVATLVAQGAAPEDLFGAVAEEVGRLLRVESGTMGRYEPDGSVTSVASWSTTEALPFLSACGGRPRARTSRGWCSRRVGRLGSTTSQLPPTRSASPCGRRASSRRSDARSSSKAISGASWRLPRPRGRFRRTPRRASLRSRSSSRRRSRTRKARQRSPRRAEGSSPPRTMRAAGSSAICTTAPSSAWSTR